MQDLLVQLETDRTATLAQRSVLDARLGKLEAAIVAVRALVGEVTGPDPAVGARTPKTGQVSQAGRPTTDAPATPDIQERAFAWLAANGPMNTKGIARGLQMRVPTVRAALVRLAELGRVHTTGVTNGQKWHVGKKSATAPQPREETVSCAGIANKRRMVPKATREAKTPRADKPAAQAEAEARKKASRYNHRLGAFKPSSVGAGSAFIARCTGCDTYVTIGTRGEVSGPGTRHECTFYREEVPA